MIVVDSFLANPVRVRKRALKSDYIDWKGFDGEVYKRISLTDVPGLQEGLQKAVGRIEMLGMGYRLNYGGELPNASIHADTGWGTHAAVLYLCSGKGGTAFWRHKATQAESIVAGQHDLLDAVKDEWNDESKWEMTGLAEHKFNRCAIYDSSLFHSRYPFAAFGDSPETGRLIAVAFFNKVTE